MIVLYILLLLSLLINYADAIEFNTDLLDSLDKEGVDFTQFKTAGYIAPGQYRLQIVLNSRSLGDFDVSYLPTGEGSSRVCFAEQHIEAIPLKEEQLLTVLESRDDQGCYDLLTLPGITVQGNLARASLIMAIPQAYLVYTAEGWIPPSRWEEGVNGVMLDYGLNARQSHAYISSVNRTELSGYGVAGINLSAWRLRANWQGQYSYADNGYVNRDFAVNRIYAYRALPHMSSQLRLGELDLGSSILDSFSYLGVSMANDESMLPPNLRGYAPEVVGIAKTNAKVVISQQGRTIYETQVPSGPFRIQELNSYVSGTLDVKVEEQDGTVQTFQVSTASIPYLSRPGFVRYKLAGGKASQANHDHDGPAFVSGEFSWGVNNGWSLFGGGIASNNYQSLALGMGRDLFHFGAVSLDMSQSWASLPNDERRSGASYRVNYSKSFEQHNSQISFAGYRFSEREFMNMSSFIEANKSTVSYSGDQKASYSIILSKQFTDLSVSAFADYTHQTYWNQDTRDRISLSLSSNFDLMDWRGISSSITAYTSTQQDQRDNGFYLSFNIPIGGAKSLSYGVSGSKSGTAQNVSFSDRLDERSSYSLTASTSNRGGSESISGFYSRRGELVDMSLNGSHVPGASSGVGLALNGGLTVVAQGAALHRGSSPGGTRVMLDTESAPDVPVSSSGPSIRTNRYGKAVLVDVGSYHRVQNNIVIDELGDDVDVIGSPVRAITLTEGAIGYQKFDMLSGSKRMMQIKQTSGKYVPMAAIVYNDKQQQLGMVADEGMVYLSGLQQGAALQVNWGDDSCELTVPTPLPATEHIAVLACR
ncbi:fimbria/pilus outer membrane usher protein [Aeromonas veronii]|uniref:fimbria/pilus outer membrane usher protein n=1 Tax=Aeromonas veronii TaxID=654 RepID=UPI003D1C3783